MTFEVHCGCRFDGSGAYHQSSYGLIAVEAEGVDRGLAQAAGCSRAVPRAAEP